MRILSLLFFPFMSFSQDLSGTWEGSGTTTNYCKISIIKWNGTYIGYTYDEGMGYCKCNFIGEFDSSSNKFKGVNKGFIQKTFFHVQSRYNLNYSQRDDQEYLKGSAFAKTIGGKFLSFGLPEFVIYKKISNSVDTTAFMKTWMAARPWHENADSMIIKDKELTFSDSVINPIPVISPTDTILMQKNERRTDTVSVITTHEKELKLTILDNGIADNDTISIIHNNKVLLSKQEVSIKGTTFNIPINDNDAYHEIILVANNLGRIPPNTALVIIEAGEKKYRLTASTDLSKNVMIIFKYE